MLFKVFLVLLILFVVYLVFRKYNVNIQTFINYLPISQTIKCFSNNQNLIKFVDEMNEIFDKYKITTGEFEISTKFNEESINANRVVAFVPCKYFPENPELLEECFVKNKIPNELQGKVEEKISDNKPSSSQVLFGIDLNEETRRVYLNYKKKGKMYLEGFNIEKESIIKKNYKEMKSDEFKRNMKDLIQNELIYNQIMSLFPEEMWKIIGAKEDENINLYKYSSYYINLSYEYKVSQFGKQLIDLLKNIYKGSNELINKWYNCFKNNNITWISIGRDKDNILFFTIYCVYSRTVRSLVDKKMIKVFNDEVKKIQSILNK